ncbi:phage baseplate assembly protein V [Brucella anthropi]|uniref:phage baseplate assembly protein V n=1 Tax=Brucella anthropi TaxID=529 RepID=UPI000F68E531|nr:phage baseplate assembly protein V [Brucella anthropi]RRY08806.1 hypothetical protein EGJ58_12965 [Brucella anthropi]
MKTIIEMASRISDLERRLDGMMRHGTVTEVDPEAGTARISIGVTGEKPFISPWVPYGQIAGALKVHSPPSVGQQMTLLSPSGDFRQAVALPMTWSNQNASPSSKGDENVLTFGSIKVELRGNEIIITAPRVLFKCDGTTLELKGGSFRASSDDFEFD